MNSLIFSSQLFLWVSRVLAIGFVALLSFAWWDESQARQEPSSLREQTDWLWNWALLTHVIPVIFLTIVIALAWKKPLRGTIGFFFYALVQVFLVGGEWIYLSVVALPPTLIGLAYLINYVLGRKITQ